eukprot:7169516-Prymnesium_polylepis.2
MCGSSAITATGDGGDCGGADGAGADGGRGGSIHSRAAIAGTHELGSPACKLLPTIVGSTRFPVSITFCQQVKSPCVDPVQLRYPLTSVKFSLGSVVRKPQCLPVLPASEHTKTIAVALTFIANLVPK